MMRLTMCVVVAIALYNLGWESGAPKTPFEIRAMDMGDVHSWRDVSPWVNGTHMERAILESFQRHVVSTPGILVIAAPRGSGKSTLSKWAAEQRHIGRCRV